MCVCVQIIDNSVNNRVYAAASLVAMVQLVSAAEVVG